MKAITKYTQALLLVALVFTALVAAGATGAAPYMATRATDRSTVNFASPMSVIELRPWLTPYKTSEAPEPDGSVWYMMSVVNDSPKSATRILIAGEPANAGLHFFPRPKRPNIRQVASSLSSISVEGARAYGRYAFKVMVPPATSAAIAVRLGSADVRPSVLAWTEPALISHNRQVSIFLAAVAGLIAAALAITGGLAIMTHHVPPRWAAGTLLGIFLVRLSTTGLLDSGTVSAVGGPYGLTAFFLGMTLFCAFRLVDAVVPIASFWEIAPRWWRAFNFGIVVLAVLAFVGLPGATFFVFVFFVVCSALLAAYLVHAGRLGRQNARVLAPSAIVFALVSAAGTLAGLGMFQDNPMAPEIVGGFAAVGAILLCLAVAAGEGIAVVPALRMAQVVVPVPAMRAAVPKDETTRSMPLASAQPTAVQAIGASHQGVFELDFARDQVRLSEEAAILLGFPKAVQTMAHTQWIARIHDEDRDVYEAALGDYRSHPGLAFRIEFRVLSESGRYPWFELRATMIGEGPKATRCLGLMADVTTRKESEVAAVDRTLRDPVTGLGNRIALMEELEHLGTRLSGITFALLDIDRFKAIHASLGDSGADAVLAAIAQRLKNRFTGLADVFRVRGDAFGLLFPEEHGNPKAIGADLVDVCAPPFSQDGRNIFAPASVGIALGQDAQDSLDLLKNAEQALGWAKRDGGSCARLFVRSLETSPYDPVVLESELRHALEADEFSVYYQPIVRLADGSVAGFEALLRWHHPAKGLIEPSEFVAHCEETGLILSLGKFALESAARDLASWQRFFPVEPPLFVSVNLSRRQLRDRNFAELLEESLSRNEIRPSTLKLEVTESVAASDDLREILARIQATGAGLSIDDFGTGQSALSQLKDLPFDVVKIDKSFLARHPAAKADRDAAVILGSIVAMAHELGRAVVVEGVEREADAQWLKEIGCEFAQGYFFAAAMPADETLKYIAKFFASNKASPSGVSGIGAETGNIDTEGS